MIQSISDIITNSSSEVFVISTDKHEEVKKFISDVCDVFGCNMNTIMELWVAEDNGYEHFSGVKHNKGDLLIMSTEDNSIPGIIMDIIECLDWYGHLPNVRSLNISHVTREHLG